MRSPAAEHRRPTLGDGVVVLLVVAAAIAAALALHPTGSGALTATVTVDGQVVARYALDTMKEPVSLPLDDLPYPLTIRAEPGRICIQESHCPGRDCVLSGWADGPGEQIICLPNRLIISLSGEGAPDFDAVSG